MWLTYRLLQNTRSHTFNALKARPNHQKTIHREDRNKETYTDNMTKIFVILFVISSCLINKSFTCGGGGGSSGGGSGITGWGLNNGGVSYTFRNGIRVTGTGSLNPPGVGVKVTIPIGRRKWDIDDKDSKEEKKQGKSILSYL